MPHDRNRGINQVSSGSFGAGGQSLPGGGGGDPRGGPGGPGQIPGLGTAEGDFPYDPPQTGGIDEHAGGGFWEWMQQNPEIATGVLGTGVEAYGAWHEGRARDRQFKESKRQYDEDNRREDERRVRRQKAYDDIVANRPEGYL